MLRTGVGTVALWAGKGLLVFQHPTPSQKFPRGPGRTKQTPLNTNRQLVTATSTYLEAQSIIFYFNFQARTSACFHRHLGTDGLDNSTRMDSNRSIIHIYLTPMNWADQRQVGHRGCSSLSARSVVVRTNSRVGGRDLSRFRLSGGDSTVRERNSRIDRTFGTKEDKHKRSPKAWGNHAP